MKSGIEILRNSVRNLAPDGATAALFAPGVAVGAGDSQFPDLVELWGFELRSGDTISLVAPVPPMPNAEVKAMMDEDMLERYLARREGCIEENKPPRGFPDDLDINQWIGSIQSELEDSDEPELLQALRNPSAYAWDGVAGPVQSIAPYTEAAQGEFELRRLNLA